MEDKKLLQGQDEGLSRRDFIKTGLAGAAAVSLAGMPLDALAQKAKAAAPATLEFKPEKGAVLRVLRWEVFVQGDKDLWNNGEMRHYPKKYACIQGSDAHAPAEMGRRTTFLRVPELNLDNLRLAFSEYSVRIRFPEEVPCEGKMIP